MMCRLTTAAILRISHGLDVRENNDPFIKLADDGARAFSAAAIPGTFLVDWIPLLKYLPGWFPGAGFKRQARRWRQITEAILEEPFERWEKEKTNGAVRGSMVEDLLSNWEHVPDYITQAKGLAVVASIAGSDTTASSITSFILVMVLNPDIQRRAQAEIDSVIGRDRLPNFDDRSLLPYIEGCVRETLRLYPPAPLGGPHAATQAGEFEGMYIPKGTWVMPNIWGILRDPELFPSPEVFDPARHLTTTGVINQEGRDPHDLVFGFGRRICPGRYFADSSVWLATATLLACFDIVPYIGVDGTPALPSDILEYGLLNSVKPFHCKFIVRSERVKSLIHDAA